MPLYEYSCQQCGKRFEVLQKFSDSPVQVHEGCGGAVERLISPSSFRFKGSGFYITDYAGGGKGANGGGAQSKHEAAESKAESTPSTKKETSTPAPAAPAAQPSSTPTQRNA
ncbi:MAG: zinc ribbon domain-containing protein [Bryobacteraceae bacterium]